MDYIAQQNTSWSAATWTNTAYWKAGDGSSITGAPMSSDNVYANGKTVTMDVATTAGNIATTPFTGTVNSAVAGGGFSVTTNVAHTGNVTTGTTNCMVIATPNLTVSVSGTAAAGTSSNTRNGISLTANGVNLTVGTCQGGTGGAVSYYSYGLYISGSNCVATVTNAYSGNGTPADTEGVVNASNSTVNITNAYGAASGNTSSGAANSGTGTMNVTNAYGGSGNGQYGVSNGNTGTLNVTNAYGGSAANAYGCINSSSGKMTVVNAYGGTNASAYGAYQSSSNGTTFVTNTYGSQSTHGTYNASTGLLVLGVAVAFPPPPASYVAGTLPSWISSALSSSSPGGVGAYNASTGSCYVERIYYGLFGGSPIWGNIKFSDASGTYAAPVVAFVSPVAEVCSAVSNVWATAGTMYDLVETTNQNLAPVPANVRYGVVYGAAGGYTGTLRMPDPSTVSKGVATDNTVGTGIITVADLGALLTR